MRKITLVLRQISADRAPALVLAAVLITGAFVGAAMPRWIDARLDVTLDRLVDRRPPERVRPADQLRRRCERRPNRDPVGPPR
jgi:hypothetical protein